MRHSERAERVEESPLTKSGLYIEIPRFPSVATSFDFAQDRLPFGRSE